MAYRNGTYVVFHANGTNIPGDEFTMINSHDTASAVRDSSNKRTLELSLLERLRNSKNMVLIIGETTRLDDDWLPFEIENAIDAYQLPIIAAYTGYEGAILNPTSLKSRWPNALSIRISNGTANVIHVPFKKFVLNDAISQFTHNKPPKGKGLGTYTKDAYKSFGIQG